MAKRGCSLLRAAVMLAGALALVLGATLCRWSLDRGICRSRRVDDPNTPDDCYFFEGSEPTPPGWTELRLTHPDLAFYVDVTIHERDGRFMATADLAEDSRDIGVGDTPWEAVRAALESLGEPCATEMAECVEAGPGGPSGP